MNGRELFQKHHRVINCFVKITNFFPKNTRLRKFEKLCNKNGKVAMFKRYLYFKTLAKSCGDNVAIFPGAYFEHIDNLSVGSNVSIHQMCYIDAEGGIDIGDDVSLAHRVSILSSNHYYSDLNIPIKYQGMKLDRTTIDRNVWVGCGAVILAGTHISSGSIVGANATVTHDVLPNFIVAGSPAKPIKERK